MAEEKDLLLKDLSARLVYGVLFMVPGISEPVELLSINPKCDKPLEIDDGPDERSSTYRKLEECIPYLRPLSEMTDEEKNELSDYLCEKCDSSKEGITFPPNPTTGKLVTFGWMQYCVDWLNEHHFDYRGLIKMGLALKAPEGMYNF